MSKPVGPSEPMFATVCRWGRSTRRVNAGKRNIEGALLSIGLASQNYCNTLKNSPHVVLRRALTVGLI